VEMVERFGRGGGSVRRDLVPSVVVAEVILFMSVHLVASGWAAMVRPPFPVPNPM
jgi:hypothetical protein